MKPQLNVTLFGGFSAFYGESPLTFGKRNNSKFSQLFQLLMTRPNQDFSKRTLIQSMYDADDIENPNDTLNSTIFRLRQYLKKSPLPEGEYFIIKGGMLRFAGPVEIKSDAWEFDCLEKKFEQESDLVKKAELAKQACELYKGEFLPQLASEEWVIRYAYKFKEKYKIMLQFFLEYCKSRHEYPKIVQYATPAMELYPLEGWEIWTIDSLNALGNFQEAKEIYCLLTKKFRQLGNTTSGDMEQSLREIELHLQMTGETLENINRQLNEEEGYVGAYCCSFLGFMDYFRILKRLKKREGIDFSVLVCNLVKIDGSPIESKKSCNRLNEKLQEIFKTCIRVGDVYTRYNANQYLLILVGADEQDSLGIGARIDSDFQKQCGRRYGISYQVISVD